MNTINKTACFTGSRPKDLFGYTSRQDYKELMLYLQKLIIFLYKNNNVKTFISGGAQGVDQLVFWAIEHVKVRYPDIQNIVYIPFPEQANNWKKTGLFSQQEYTLLLSKADAIKIISNKENGVLSYLQRNTQMVNDADFVIVVSDWDTTGKKPKSKGTAYTFKLGKNANKPIFWINPFTYQMRSITPA